MTYVVDTNFFITAHRSHYPFDVVKSFWETVNKLASTGKIISIDKVKNEIYKNHDELKDWCLNYLPEGFFCDSSVSIPEYGKLISWAASKSSHYKSTAIKEFSDEDNADPFLIAYVLSNREEFKVVTYELNDGSKKRIKIPAPCDEYGISYINPIQMFRELGVSF